MAALRTCPTCYRPHHRVRRAAPGVQRAHGQDRKKSSSDGRYRRSRALFAEFGAGGPAAQPTRANPEPAAGPQRPDAPDREFGKDYCCLSHGAPVSGKTCRRCCTWGSTRRASPACGSCKKCTDEMIGPATRRMPARCGLQTRVGKGLAVGKELRALINWPVRAFASAMTATEARWQA